MSAAEPISTAGMTRRYGTPPGTLLRYEASGWIASLVRHRGSGAGRELLWAGWARRMVALIGIDQDPLGYSHATAEGGELRRRVARGLAVEPDAPWFVDTGGPALEPCGSGEEALALALSQPGPVMTLVSPPRS